MSEACGDIKGLVDPEAWQTYQDVNSDSYSKACVDVARNVMKYLDTFEDEFELGYHPNLRTTHGIICVCDDQDGITGFMAGCVRNMVARCYKDGWKFWLADVLNRYSSFEDAEAKAKTLSEGEVVLAGKEEARAYAESLVKRYKQTVPTKEDDRPQKGGYAPGDYISTCPFCGDKFLGDKRSVECADCAYSKDEEPVPEEESFVVEDVPVTGTITLNVDCTEIIRISPNGDVAWRGRTVESDEEFKEAMMDLHSMLSASVKVGEDVTKLKDEDGTTVSLTMSFHELEGSDE